MDGSGKEEPDSDSSAMNSGNDKINPDDYKPTPNPGSQQLSDIGGVVLGAVNVVGAFVSVAMLMIIGIKFMMGSVEEKAEYKKTMFPYTIGAILLFSGTTLINCIYKMFN